MDPPIRVGFLLLSALTCRLLRLLAYITTKPEQDQSNPSRKWAGACCLGWSAESAPLSCVVERARSVRTSPCSSGSLPRMPHSPMYRCLSPARKAPCCSTLGRKQLTKFLYLGLCAVSVFGRKATTSVWFYTLVICKCSSCSRESTHKAYENRLTKVFYLNRLLWKRKLGIFPERWDIDEGHPCPRWGQR